LEHTCLHLIKKSEGKTPVLIIDELPFLLDKIVAAGRSDEAASLLDNMRALRQRHSALRMVFCGSLGLHIVLDKLRASGYSGQPVNDMPAFEVAPLSPVDAAYLSGCLLTGERVVCEDLDSCAEALAQVSSGVPFYIQHMVRAMAAETAVTWTPTRIQRLPQDLFTAPGDPVAFQYYEGRIGQHYPNDIAERALVVLDALSRDKRGLPFDELLNLVRHDPKTQMVDSESILQTARMLRDDHYLVQDGKRWRFKLEIIRRWWSMRKGD
jgi:hypothetical protein